MTQYKWKDDGMEKEEALALCDEVDEALVDLPERAEEFVDSVTSKVQSMRESAEEFGGLTKNQVVALENMRMGAEKWKR